MLVKVPEVHLCPRVSLGSGPLHPLRCFGVVEGHAGAGVIHPGKIILSRRVIALGGGPKPGGRLSIVLRNAFAAKE